MSSRDDAESGNLILPFPLPPRHQQRSRGFLSPSRQHRLFTMRLPSHSGKQVGCLRGATRLVVDGSEPEQAGRRLADDSSQSAANRKPRRPDSDNRQPTTAAYGDLVELCLIVFLHPAGNVPTAMQDAPDVDMVCQLDVEDQIGMALGLPEAQPRQTQVVCVTR